MPQRRNSSAPHPYGYAHRQRRNAGIQRALGTWCPGVTMPDGTLFRSTRCVGRMTDPTCMHLDHSTPVALGGTKGDRVVCKPCNLGAGATLGNQLRGLVGVPAMVGGTGNRHRSRSVSRSTRRW